MSVRSSLTVSLPCQLSNIIAGHMQCCVRLAWVHSVFWVMMLVQSLCLLGLKANGYVYSGYVL